ncbi:C48 family peptidase [Bradyrhizobium barranii subsp. apii]|uniref:Ulp1 family isopeptidase n=1 Tax=Bradyrhizobium barranii TaxID=2992140 RepID=UPI001CD37BF9|nr:Ulp1 family isopeptidase [Bradyrhizobium barranii]UPT95908.1 C48 family peptidase [Bradyrhizobium barranii subsp. apii]
MPGASALQPGQSAEVYGTRRRPLYSQDADLILELEEALIKGGAVKRTAKENVGHLLRLGRWLFENKKQAIAARLDDESLTVDACEFFGKGNPTRLLTAIGHLRTSQSTGGIVPIADRAKLNPYPQDAALIEEYKNEATTGTVSTYAFTLSSFSDYLRKNNKKGIAARLSGKALDGDVGDYKKDVGGNRRIGAALAHLRKSRAGAKAMELERHISPGPDPERAALMEPRRVSDAAAEHRASQEAGSWPEKLPAEGYDQDLVLGLMDEPGPSHSALQPAQSTGVLRRQRKQPLYSEDGPLISGLEKALIKSGATEISAKANVYSLRSFGRWLVANNKESIAARLNDESLTVDAREFFGKGNPTRLLTAIGHLRTSQSTGGIVPIADRAKLNPYPKDAALIKEYKNEATTGTASTYAVVLNSFSDYLRENNKPGIAARLSGKALDGDVESYRKDAAGRNRNIGAALTHLRKSSAGANAMELERHISPFPDPEDAALMEPRRVGDAAAEHSASQEAGSWPEELLPAEAHDQDLLWGLMDEPGPSSSALQPARSTGVRRKQPLYSEDAPLISELEEALIKGGAAEATAKDYAGSLRRFGRWLFANDKKGIAARLDDESLTIDAREFIGKGDPAKLLAAIDHLRTSQSTGGIVPIAGRAKLNSYPQDAALIKEYKNEATTGTASTYAFALSSFSDYLRENNKKGIAARLSGKALDGDVEDYKDAGGNRRIGAALTHLRKSQAGAKAMELERHISPGPDPENAVLMEPMPAGGAAAQHSASQDAGSWPKELLPVEGYDQDLLWELMDEPGPSSSLLEPAARHDQSSDPGESIRPLNWGYDRQQFPDEPIGALAKSNLLPSKEVLINDEHDTAELRPAKRPRTLDNLHGVAIERQLSEIVASGGRLLTSAPTHQLGASPWQAQPTMQGSGYQDATALQRAVSRPLVLPEGYDQDLRLMVEDGPPWPGVPPEQAQDIVQAGQQEPAWSASTWSPQMPLNFDWSMWPMLEASPAQAARARSSTYGGPPLVDLTAATPSESRDDVNSVPAFPSTSYDAQIGALGPTASSHGRGLVLEGTEWLGDEHVLRDYQLLAQELRGNNPNLAARTRFVDPLITLVSLRLGTESEMLRAFQRIVHDQNGDDTADFLFLPVNNARATNLPGTHWSLLFVDRRDRERPVAYRYDSMGEYNNRPAAELAARLGARLESRGMTQQLNTYDCGVFVVDGTRALVRQLEQGRAPHLLNLSSLVANRQALQNRLRG